MAEATLFLQIFADQNSVGLRDISTIRAAPADLYFSTLFLCQLAHQNWSTEDYIHALPAKLIVIFLLLSESKRNN